MEEVKSGEDGSGGSGSLLFYWRSAEGTERVRAALINRTSTWRAVAQPRLDYRVVEVGGPHLSVKLCCGFTVLPEQSVRRAGYERGEYVCSSYSPVEGRENVVARMAYDRYNS